MMEKKLILQNEVEQLSKLSDFIDSIAEELSIDSSMAMSLNLAIEEAVTNVVMYAYPEGEVGNVVIIANFTEGMLIFTISDNGIPFDPTSKTDADVTLNVEERPIGGLGIFLVKNLMDFVGYERKNGYNILTLKKKI
jgi:anti-sigma regulatory factor (Ser/Thr protein kinase)